MGGEEGGREGWDGGARRERKGRGREKGVRKGEARMRGKEG